MPRVADLFDFCTLVSNYKDWIIVDGVGGEWGREKWSKLYFAWVALHTHFPSYLYIQFKVKYFIVTHKQTLRLATNNFALIISRQESMTMGETTKRVRDTCVNIFSCCTIRQKDFPTKKSDFWKRFNSKLFYKVLIKLSLNYHLT